MTIPRSFRFGVFIEDAPSRAVWRAKARQAESLGYATVLLGDHLDITLAPIAALSIAAEVTTTLRVGSFVLGNDFRHPVLLAREAATLDLLSDGRLELGLGTGWASSDYHQTGISLDPPGVRIDRLDEAIQIIKGFFAAEPFTFAGTHYRVRDLTGVPQPVQRPHPPLLIGGGGRRLLSLAARHANIVGVSMPITPLEAFAQRVTWIRAAAGERLGAIELNLFVPFVVITNQRHQAAEHLLNILERDYGLPAGALTVDDLLTSPTTLIGTVDQIVDDVQRRREQYGFSYLVVREPMEAFAPVIARLTGS